MKLALRNILILCLLALTSACDFNSLIEKIAPEREAAFAQQVIDQLRARQYAEVEQLMSAELAVEIDRDLLIQMADQFPSAEPLSVQLIGFEMHSSNELRNGSFSFEYQFDQGYNVANVAYRATGEKRELVSLYVRQADVSLEQWNAFSLGSKSTKHYVVLAATLLIPLFIIISLVACIRTPIAKHKWAWIIFVLIGFGSFTFNWSSGALGISPLSANVLGASIMSGGPYSPWILSFSVPVGAIWFWLSRRRLLAIGQTADQTEGTES